MLAATAPSADRCLVRCRFAPHLRRLDRAQRRRCVAAALRALARRTDGFDIYFLPFRAGGAAFALSARLSRRSPQGEGGLPRPTFIEVEIAALAGRVPWRCITESEARIAAARRGPRR
jgi:hypothetical protein